MLVSKTKKYLILTQETKNPKVSHENRVTYLSKLHPVQTVRIEIGLGSVHCTVQRRSDPVENGTPKVHPTHKLEVIWATWPVGNNVEDGFV